MNAVVPSIHASDLLERLSLDEVHSPIGLLLSELVSRLSLPDNASDHKIGEAYVNLMEQFDQVTQSLNAVADAFDGLDSYCDAATLVQLVATTLSVEQSRSANMLTCPPNMINAPAWERLIASAKAIVHAAINTEVNASWLDRPGAPAARHIRLGIDEVQCHRSNLYSEFNRIQRREISSIQRKNGLG